MKTSTWLVDLALEVMRARKDIHDKQDAVGEHQNLNFDSWFKLHEEYIENKILSKASDIQIERIAEEMEREGLI